MAPNRTCHALTLAGAPCRSFALPDSDYCISHSPEHKEQHRAASRAGGVAKSKTVRSAKEWAAMSRHLDIEDLPGVLVGAGLACVNGQLEPSRVTALASAMKAAVDIAEIGILERRIQELEQIFGDKSRGE